MSAGAGQEKGDMRHFWVKLACTSLDFGMMVWSARARCFMAGTPVVLDLAPEPMFLAAAEEDKRLLVMDGIGWGALLMGVGTIMLRPKRKHPRQTDPEIPAEIGHDDDPLPDPEPEPESKEINQGNQAVDGSKKPGILKGGNQPNEVSSPMQKKQPNRSWFWPILTLASFLLAGFCFAPRLAQLWQKSEPAAVAAPVQQPIFLTKPIEQIRPGDRVLAHNPEVTDEERNVPEPDSATWRLIELEMTGEDGHRIDVRLLRPMDWIEKHGGFPGGKVRLELEEIGAVGYAGVLSVSDCPPIRPGRGRIVTGTFCHNSNDIIKVNIEGQKPIGCTAGHLFWSEDRQAFVPACELKEGERLRTADKQIAPVKSLTRRIGTAPVYNLEIDIEHVYYVGQAGVLVHNAGDAYWGRTDFIVYVSHDGTYVGRTVGSLRNRWGSEANKYKELYTNLTYDQARGLEQVEIERRGLDHLRNIRNGIDPTRRDADALRYRDAARNYLNNNKPKQPKTGC